MSIKTVPNFLIGGVNNTGTSFLYSVLKQHPEIYVPPEMRPEPSFFFKSWEFEKGLDYYSSRWFSEVPESSIAIGEKSANYLFGGATTAQRIKKTLPDVKIIFILRNPIERAWANYRFTVLEGLENLPFEEAVRQESRRVREETGIWAEIQPRSYIGRGYYAQKLKEFFPFFPRSQLHIVKSELLLSDTQHELKKIYDFLGVRMRDFKPKPSASFTSLNIVDPAIQMELRKYFGDRFDTVVEATRKELDLSQFIERPGDLEAINRLRSNMKAKKDTMPAGARAYLADVFSDDMQELTTIVDFDISDWK